MSQIIFGITGALASGKTHTAQQLIYLAKQTGADFFHIEVDQIRRDILSKSKDLYHQNLRKKLLEGLEIPAKHPPYFVEGSLLGELIFSDPKKMAVFKEIVNPEIVKHLKEISYKHAIVAIEWSMLIEDGWMPLVGNNILLIHCTSEKQKGRLRDSDLPLKQLEKRIVFQPSFHERKKRVSQIQAQEKKGNLIIWNTTENPDIKSCNDLYLQIIKEFSVK